jgi:DNA-binding response OmpR family regulator
VQGNILFDFLAKPFVPAQLKAKLDEIMNRVGRGPDFPAMEEI